MNKEILFVYPEMMLGGSTTALIALLKNLDKEKYNIELQLMRKEGPLLNVVPEEITIIKTQRRELNKLKKLIAFIIFYFEEYIVNNHTFVSLQVAKADFQVKKLCYVNKKKYDIAVGFLEGWSDRYVSYNVNATKKITWLHSTYKNITKNPNTDILWMKDVDKIAFVTDACKKEFDDTLPMFKNKSITIKNIVDEELIRKQSKDIYHDDKMYKMYNAYSGFKIITVCRLQINTKGIDRIITCAEKMKKNSYEFMWVIVGGGEDYDEISKMITEHNLNENLYLVGPRINPYPFIKESNIMCMPSRYEGKPIVITESMILGVPPVVTEYMSANEQIINHLNGVVVNNADDSIYDGVKKCMDDSKFYNKIKENLNNTNFGNREYIYQIEDELFD